MNKTSPARSKVLVLKQILNLIPRGMINYYRSGFPPRAGIPLRDCGAWV